MLEEEARLLKAIARDPEDDAVRLGYADWLTENGDPNRGELIRLQCNLERGVDWETGKEASPERLKELQGREKELIKEMIVFKKGERPGIREFESTPEIAAIAADPDRIIFRRGMIDFLSLAFTRITELPADLHVGGNLYLIDTPITELPSHLHVGGNLDLVHTPITELPSDLHVGGNLDLTDTYITIDTARPILTMPNLSKQAKITGLETAGSPHLAAQARRLPETNTGLGTPPRP
jgi:uncharacterized protein (TIGR02996 family)